MKKHGTALIMSLVFAMLLMVMAASYSMMLRGTKSQTIQIEESAKYDLLAQGLIDKAILKFQLYPNEFYAAWEAAASPTLPISNRQTQYLNDYVLNDPSLRLVNFGLASSSFTNQQISVQIASMALLTNANWNQDALRIEANVSYITPTGKHVDKTIVKVLSIKREVVK